MGSPYREGTIRLADGRRVSYAEYGDPDGVPVVNCHGAPSSRRERYFPNGDGYRRLGVRLIGIDRPGSGRTDPAPGRRIVDWPEDAEQVLDALHLGDVRLLALSAGVPYAFALARALPDRVGRIAAVGAAHHRTSRGPGRRCRPRSAPSCCAPARSRPRRPCPLWARARCVRR